MIKFWNFVTSDDSAELLLYGELCSDEPWFGDDYVAYRQFISDLKEITADTIHLRINSPGGDVMAANAIFNQLKDSGKKIVAHIDGMCASAATIPLMAAETIIASCNAMILIHDPMVGLCGYYSSKDLNEMVEYCGKIKESIISTYRSRITDVTEEEFSSLMSEEKWLTANEAQDIGLVDEVAYSDISDVKDYGKYITINSVKVKKEYFKEIPVNRRNGVSIHAHMQKNIKNEGGNEHMDHEEIKTLDDLKRVYPEFCKAIADEAVEQERERMKQLDEIGVQVPAEMLVKAKYEKPMDAKELAFQALVAERNLGNDFMNQLRNDMSSSGADSVKPSPNEGNPENNAASDESRKSEREKKVNNLAAAMDDVSKRRNNR